MAVGRAPALASARRLKRGIDRFVQVVYALVFGDVDLHTHIRWRAIKPAVKPTSQILDVGCGDGTITLELARTLPRSSIRGIELSEPAVAAAEGRRRDTGLTNVSFDVGDLNKVPFGEVDQVLLLDVIEHIEDDVGLINAAGRAVRPGGRIVVSTPTPDYPRFFGREFHKAVGHVRDGYTISDLTALLRQAGFTIESARCYTRLPSSIVCALFYRRLWKMGRIGIALSPVLNAVSFLDVIWPSSRFSTSVLVVGVKT